jgi:hypothetical protein
LLLKLSSQLQVVILEYTIPHYTITLKSTFPPYSTLLYLTGLGRGRGRRVGGAGGNTRHTLYSIIYYTILLYYTTLPYTILYYTILQYSIYYTNCIYTPYSYPQYHTLYTHIHTHTLHIHTHTHTYTHPHTYTHSPHPVLHYTLLTPLTTQVLNPACEEVVGCGPWTQPVKKNPGVCMRVCIYV